MAISDLKQESLRPNACASLSLIPNRPSPGGITFPSQSNPTTPNPNSPSFGLNLIRSSSITTSTSGFRYQRSSEIRSRRSSAPVTPLSSRQALRRIPSVRF